MKRFRSYGFWTALAGALTMLLASIGKYVGFSVDNELITEIIMAFAGLLVVLGVVIMPKKDENKEENDKTDIEKNDESEEDKLKKEELLSKDAKIDNDEKIDKD